MKRRSFLRGLFGVAPAIIMTPGLLMPIKPALIVPAKIVTIFPVPAGFEEGDFVCFDTAFADGERMGFVRKVDGVLQIVYDNADSKTWFERVQDVFGEDSAKVADALVVGDGEEFMDEVIGPHSDVNYPVPDLAAKPYRGLERMKRWNNGQA